MSTCGAASFRLGKPNPVPILDLRSYRLSIVASLSIILAPAAFGETTRPANFGGKLFGWISIRTIRSETAPKPRQTRAFRAVFDYLASLSFAGSVH